MLLCIISSGCALTGKGAGLRSECARISHLSRSGEHKPAVDAAAKLEGAGEGCPQEVRDQVLASRETLMRADAYVHKAVKRRKEGNLFSARANLERALEIYPRYYWVQTLIKNVDRSIQAELENLRQEAIYFESQGDPENALSRVEDAMKLSPGDGKLDSEAARLEQVIVEAQAQRDARSLLGKARDLLEAGRYVQAHRFLTDGGLVQKLGAEGRDLLAEVDKRRQDEVSRRFADAVEMEKAGDLNSAARGTFYVLDMSFPGDETAEGIVNFTRILGMKFYSAGELSKAKELWAGALDLDPKNPKLLGYLQEVQTRLDSLDRIKKGETGGEADER